MLSCSHYLQGFSAIPGGEPDILHQQYITLEKWLSSDGLHKNIHPVFCASLIRGGQIFTAKTQTLPTVEVRKFGSWSPTPPGFGEETAVFFRVIVDILTYLTQSY